MNREQIDELVTKATEQGYIYAKDIDREIVKIELTEDSFNTQHRCWYIETGCGLTLSIYASDYGKDCWLAWALEKKELENE